MATTHKMIILHGLREAMREKQASRKALSLAAGVCEQVVHKAMNCEPVRFGMGNLILQALEERQFQYKRRVA